MDGYFFARSSGGGEASSLISPRPWKPPAFCVGDMRVVVFQELARSSDRLRLYDSSVAAAQAGMRAFARVRACAHLCVRGDGGGGGGLASLAEGEAPGSCTCPVQLTSRARPPGCCSPSRLLLALPVVVAQMQQPQLHLQHQAPRGSPNNRSNARSSNNLAGMRPSLAMRLCCRR